MSVEVEISVHRMISFNTESQCLSSSSAGALERRWRPSVLQSMNSTGPLCPRNSATWRTASTSNYTALHSQPQLLL